MHRKPADGIGSLARGGKGIVTVRNLNLSNDDNLYLCTENRIGGEMHDDNQNG